jgi:hypothetical protein
VQVQVSAIGESEALQKTKYWTTLPQVLTKCLGWDGRVSNVILTRLRQVPDTLMSHLPYEGQGYSCYEDVHNDRTVEVSANASDSELTNAIHIVPVLKLQPLI